MADVAAEAGVSVMTVSRVLNGYPGVAEETRLRVETAVTRLGYRANTAARILAGGPSGTLGMIAVEPEHYGPAQLLYAVEGATRRAGLGLQFATFVPGVDDLTEVVEQLSSGPVDGVVIEAPLDSVVHALADLRTEVPVVVVGGEPGLPQSTVAVDQAAGGRLATEHLLSLGHRTVHHVRGDVGWVDADRRERGWADALRDAGAPPGRSIAGDWSAQGGYEVGRDLAADPEVTAVFAANDQTALGVLRALHEHGRGVPEEVGVVGFDDTPDSGYLVPPLTTVRQDLRAVGRWAVELVLRHVQGDTTPQDLLVPPELIVRVSAPRAG